MAEIIPAILSKSYDELLEKLDIVANQAPVIQIDICDGSYVPNRTWPYLKGHDIFFEDIVSQEQAMPHWENVDFEFDLMVKNPSEKIPDFISAGASRIVVHLASIGSEEELQNIITDYGKHSEEVGLFDIQLGIALKSTDSPELIKNIAENIHFVQVMGIAREGFQGQDFDKNSLTLIKELRATYPEMPISVDGGVNLETAKEVVEAGASRLVIGSALFNEVDFSGTMRAFKAI